VDIVRILESEAADTMRPRRRDLSGWWIGFATILGAIGSGPASGQQEPAVVSGVQFLKGHYAGQQAGESAMIALALLKADVPIGDPAVAGCVARFRSRFTSNSYEPERGKGPGVYEAAAAAMALANLDAAGNRGYLGMIASYVTGQQRANGSWDYAGRDHGDTSISQYAVLGLWEAENAGVDISPSVWDRAASWYLSTQHASGAWVYHNDEAQYAETLSMTAAGIGSLLICQRQLERYRQDRRATSTHLTALTNDTQSDFKPSTTNPQIEQATRRGIQWISSNFAPDRTIAGPSPFYALYGIERIGALGERQMIGKVDWFERGRAYIRSNQRADGSWQGTHGAEMNTVWAMLFLTKSTAKSLKRIQIQKLGAGTLLGGRGLPSDLSSMTVAGGRVVSRPMNGAIEGMLTVLEDPRAQDADAAVAGMVERYYREGPDVLRPFKARFRKMLNDRDPGVRRVAAWSLAHTGDMDVVPALIDALRDADEEVINSARLGLQVLSRKIDGLGPPSPSTPEQRSAAAERWRNWFNAVRPLDLDEDDNPTAASQGTGAAPTAGSPSRSPSP
jgi:hypothetical protein